MNNRIYSYVLASILCLLSNAVRAAAQGAIGPSSSGQVHISVTKSNGARISRLNDLFISMSSPNYGKEMNRLLSDDLCVYSNSQSGSYTIQASGSGEGGAFLVSNGDKTVPFTVQWNDGSHATTLQAGVMSGTMTSAYVDSASCSKSNSARLAVKIGNADQELQDYAQYSGILNLVVSPN